MKTFLDWMLKTLTGAFAVAVVLLALGPHILPLTMPLLTVDGRKLILNMPDVVELIVFVWSAATALYVIGFSVWKLTRFFWSKF